MKTLRTIIIDDEPDAVTVLSKYLETMDGVALTGVANSADEGIALIQTRQPELILLDVEMPQKSGFDLLAAFPKPSFQVIFVTAFDHYAITAIRHSALDYILKPVNFNELSTAINRAHCTPSADDTRLFELQRMTANRAAIDRIIIPSHKGFQTLPLHQICSIEAVPGNYVFFTLKDGNKHLCTKPLSHYESLLSQACFFRIHRSCMVNLKHVTGYDNSNHEVCLSNQSKYQVATRRLAAFRRIMRSLEPM